MHYRVIQMYCEGWKVDAWYVERLAEKVGCPDYYGPWLREALAEDALQLLEEIADER